MTVDEPDRAGLRAYYEQESRLRLRPSIGERRAAVRHDFVTLLGQEGRTSVLDLGAGPGGDGAGFTAAGCRYLGVDLAHGNGVAAAESGLTVIQGSVAALPVRGRSFSAGWSMSVLMHLSEGDMDRALAELARCLQPGAPALIGLWGDDGEARSVRIQGEGPMANQARDFVSRPFGHSRALIGRHLELEWTSRWPFDTDAEYHLFRARARA